MISAQMGSALTSFASILLNHGIAGAIVKTSVILAAAGIVAMLATRSSAAMRHAIWLVGLTGSLAVSVLSLGGPSLDIRIPVETRRAVATRGFATTAPVRGVYRAGVFQNRREFVRPAARTVVHPRRIVSSPRTTFSPASGQLLIAMVWLVGCLVVIGRSIIGHLALRRVIALGNPLATPEWQLTLFRAAGDAGLRRPLRLFESDSVQSPITSGWLSPVVILPTDAAAWEEERRRIVLIHELAHVARGDYASQLLGTMVTALYWFNPMVWFAVSRLRTEAEHAADDMVLAAGTTGVAYATHLLDLAREERSLHLAAAVAVGMIRSTRLEGRFRAMLDSTRPRATVSPKLLAMAVVTALAVFLPLGGLRVRAYAMEVGRAVPAFAMVPSVRTGTAPVVVYATEKGRVAVQVAAVSQRADSTFEKTINAASGDRLMLDLRTGGNIILHGWNEPHVRLRARLAGRDWRETQVSLERSGREVRLRSDLERSGNSSSTSHSFELWVPQSIDVEIASAGGAISIDNLNGEFSGHTGGGGISIVSSSGSANITTGGGTITVSDSDLRGEVSTGGGGVTITNVTGGLRGNSGSGPVITALPSGTTVRGASGAISGRVVGSVVEGGSGRNATTTTITDGGARSRVVTRGVTTTNYPGDAQTALRTRGFLDGAVSITKAGGEITMDELPRGGVVRTGGGRIAIGASRGLVDVSTGGGDIELTKIGGDAIVSTGAGDVTIHVENVDGAEHTIAVYSGKGRVLLELPANLDARLEIETAYTENSDRRTRIQSDVPLSETESPDWDDRFGTPRKFVRGTATLGNGRGLIRVRTVNGDVVVRRR